MNARLEMTGHKISGLRSPVDSDDAVNKEYIATRLKTITELLNDIVGRINKLEKDKTI